MELLKKQLCLLFAGSCLLSGCGGSAPVGSGSPNGGGSPNVSLSVNTLTFNGEVVDTVSPPATIMLTNSGTATLNIASVGASANFAQTNNCGSTLASGANCTINVTFTPGTTGSVSGTLSVTDNAAGSPQTVALTGTGEPAAAQDTLTGVCWGELGSQCVSGQDVTDCPVGQQAIAPTLVASGCFPPESLLLDTSSSCQFQTSSGHTVTGQCVVTYGGSAPDPAAGGSVR